MWVFWGSFFDTGDKNNTAQQDPEPIFSPQLDKNWRHKNDYLIRNPKMFHTENHLTHSRYCEFLEFVSFSCRTNCMTRGFWMQPARGTSEDRFLIREPTPMSHWQDPEPTFSPQPRKKFDDTRTISWFLIQKCCTPTTPSTRDITSLWNFLHFLDEYTSWLRYCGCEPHLDDLRIVFWYGR